MRLTKHQKMSIVRAIMDDVPRVDVVAEREKAQAAIIKLMSPAVRKVYKECPEALKTYYDCDLYDGTSWDTRYVITGNVTEDQAREVLAPFHLKLQEREEARRKLKAAIEGCSTLKQLNEALPEFSAYFPTEAATTKNLPAVANLAADMMALGWPKKNASPT